MPRFKYDHLRFSKILTACVESSDWDTECPISGKWIEEDGDPFRVMFDSYQEDESYENGIDKNLLCYVVFIHQNCLDDGFLFPDHETVFGVIKHRPKEEAALIGWFNKIDETWNWLHLDDSGTELSPKKVMEMLEGIWGRFWGRAPQP